MQKKNRKQGRQNQTLKNKKNERNNKKIKKQKALRQLNKYFGSKYSQSMPARYALIFNTLIPLSTVMEK